VLRRLIPFSLVLSWLLVHALYASIVRNSAKPDPAAVDKFAATAQAYVAKEGTNAALAADWLRALGR